MPRKKQDAPSDEPVPAPVGDYPERPDSEALADPDEIAAVENRGDSAVAEEPAE